MTNGGARQRPASLFQKESIMKIRDVLATIAFFALTYATIFFFLLA